MGHGQCGRAHALLRTSREGHVRSGWKGAQCALGPLQERPAREGTRRGLEQVPCAWRRRSPAPRWARASQPPGRCAAVSTSLYFLGLRSGGDEGAGLAGLPRTRGSFCSALVRSRSTASLTTAPHSVKCYGRGGAPVPEGGLAVAWPWALVAIAQVRATPREQATPGAFSGALCLLWDREPWGLYLSRTAPLIPSSQGILGSCLSGDSLRAAGGRQGD